MSPSHSYVVMAGLVPAIHGNGSENAECDPFASMQFWLADAA
jgi:hypothetical protein